LVVISHIRGWVLRLKNLVILVAQAILIKAKLFAPELIRAVSRTLYLFFNTIYSIVKCLPPISQLRLIFDRLIVYPRQEFCPRVLLFPTCFLLLAYITLLLLP
jgi:hypothetical protein